MTPARLYPEACQRFSLTFGGRQFAAFAAYQCGSIRYAFAWIGSHLVWSEAVNLERRRENPGGLARW